MPEKELPFIFSTTTKTKAIIISLFQTTDQEWLKSIFPGSLKGFTALILVAHASEAVPDLVWPL